MNNTIYLLLFLLVISISVFIFYNYKEKTIEKFYNQANNNIESDTFPNLQKPLNYIEIEYYSTIRGIHDEFVTFISDYRNFKGHIARNSVLPSSVPRQTTPGRRPDRNTDRMAVKDIRFPVTWDVPWTFGSSTETHDVYLFGQGFAIPMDNGSAYLRPATNVDTALTNIDKFINYTSQFAGGSVLNFLRNNQIYNTNKLKVKINPTNYLASNWYDLSSMINGFFNWRAETHMGGSREVEFTVSYDVGKFLGVYPNRNTAIDNAVTNKLRVYTYGSLNETQSKDFKDSAFFGSLFNFRSTDFMNLYLRIPYLSSNLNGINLQYSHGLFSNDVQPRNPRQTFLFDPDDSAINYNNTLFNYLNLTDNTLRFPLSSDPIYIDGNPSGVTSNINSLSLKQQFVGVLNRKLVSLMPVSLRKYITSWSYNRTLRILEKRFNEIGNNNTVKFYFLMGLSLNNYFYSKNINDTTGMNNWKSLLSQYGLNNPDATFGPETVGGIAGYDLVGEQFASYYTDMGYGLINAYFNRDAYAMTYRIGDNRWWLHNSNYPASAIFTNTGHKYRRVNMRGTLPTINNELINELYSYYTSYIQKLVPDYGAPLNVLDQRIMDSIAQEFYEKSEGLHEITHIYDIYRVGSNMIDIRFDKKQRLDNIRYLNYRNKYIPQLNEYNRILSMFEDGTWTKHYTNIDDYNIALSTSIVNIEPILNPVYPIGGDFNYINLITLQSLNNTTMIRLSNALNTSTERVKQVVGSNNLSNALTQITPSSTPTNEANLLKPSDNNSVYQDLSVIQGQYYSTVNAAQDLSNMINGIETNVARIFISLDNSNFSINAIALGINAALSYNLLYNGNIDTPLTGEGNANYQPTIRYTKNIKPPIQCGNVDFMKKTAKLYRDTVFTDISNIVLSNIPYNSNDGIVVVDKILGFTQINNTTCGYSWIETQYDDLTNKPVKRNTVNIQIPFIYDDSEYQNTQVTFDNNPAIMKYSSNSYPFGNLNGWIDIWSAEKRFSLQYQISNYNSNISQLIIELSDLAARSNIKYDFINTIGWAFYSNTTTLHMEAIAYLYSGAWSPTYFTARNYNIRGQNVNTFIINNFSNKTYFELYEANQRWHRDNTNNLYAPYLNSLIYDPLLQYSYYSYKEGIRDVFAHPLFKYTNATGDSIGLVTNTFNPFIWGIELKIFDYDTISQFVESTRREHRIKTNTLSEIRTLKDNLTAELNNLDVTTNQMKTSRELVGNVGVDPIIFNFILNNLVPIPRLLSDSDNKLTDVDGACPALRCENPTVMTQIMEQYNTDSNNPDKILNILNAYTVNEYQCDYKVTTLITPSNITTNINLRNQLQSNISRLNLLKIPANNSNLLTLNNEYNTLNSQFLQVNSNYQSLNNQINTSLTNGLNSSSNYINALNIKNENNNSLTIIINNLSNHVLNAFRNINLTSRYQTVRLGAGFDNNETLYHVYFTNHDPFFSVYNWRRSLNSVNIIQTYQLLVQNNPDVFFYTDLYPDNKVSLVPSPDVDFLNLISQSNIANTNYQNSLTNFNNIATPLTASIQQSNIALYNELTNLTNIRTTLQNSINLNRTNYQNMITLLTNQVNNLQSQFNSLGITSNSVFQQSKSFQIGIDIRDCSYYYGEVSNTGYFVSENQNPIAVSNNKPGATGFHYLTTTFNTFNNDIVNLINPLIDEAIKQSSNMLNAVSLQREDTYTAIGRLNTITFSNAPALNHSNILNMLQTNKRFFNSFFNEGFYTYGIKGFGITNYNRLHVLVDYGAVNNMEIFTGCLEYEIRVTPSYLDYTAYYSRNVTANMTNYDVLNMTTQLPYIKGSNFYLSNNIPKDFYKRRFFGEISRINNRWVVLRTWADAFDITNTSNIYNALLSVGYNQNDIERYAIDSNNPIDSSNYTIEYQLNTDENLPYNKRFFKIKVGYRPYDTNPNDYLYLLKESVPLEAIISVITNPYDQNLIDLFHRNFKDLNKISPSKQYNSIIGQVYSIKQMSRVSLYYSASVYHTNSANAYINTILPNEIIFNNLKYFQFILFPGSSNSITVGGLNEVQPFTNGQGVNDFSKVTNLPSPEFYRSLSQSICFPPINQETVNSKIKTFINTSPLTTYLKNILPYDSNVNIFDFIKGDDTNKNLTEVVTRVTTSDGDWNFLRRKFNKLEFDNITFFHYKFEIINISINYNTYSYSLILKPYYIKYYKVISEVLQTLYNSSESTIIFPPYSNITDFISDEFGHFIIYPDYTGVDDYRILLQFSFTTTGKTMIDRCSRDFNNIMNSVTLTRVVQFTNLNQSFRYNNINYTNFNNFLTLNNFNNNNLNNIYIEYPIPRNQYPVNRTNPAAIPGSREEFLTLISPSFLNQRCLMYYSHWFPMSLISQRSYNRAQGPIYGKPNNRNTFAYDYIIIGGIELDYPRDYYTNQSNYTEVTLFRQIGDERHIPSTPIPYDRLLYPAEIASSSSLFSSSSGSGGNLCERMDNLPYTIVLKNIITTTDINAYALSNGYFPISGFTDYKPEIQKFTNYKPYLFIKFESKSPLLFNSITLYDSNKEQIKYKVKDKNSNSIIFEVSEPISGYSFITNNSGTSPNSWIIKGSDGKTWEVIHEESYELEGKKLYQTPIFYLDGTTATVEQPQSFEKPEVDVKKFVRYYKQKVNSSVNPEFKKYMYSNNVYYFIFDEYDLNNNLVAKDLIVGFEVYGNNIKKAILYEDEDGNNKPFDLSNSKEKTFWDSMIGLALEFQDF